MTSDTRIGYSSGLLSRMNCTKLIVALLLITHVSLLAVSGWWQSPTLNEPGHLVAGLHHWRTGQFTVYRVNPPLVQLVAALPTLLIGSREDWSAYHEFVGARPEFELGEAFIAANRERSMLYFRLARWACIPFSVLGALICFAWARDLFGDLSGLFAMTLWCFSPMILGHASMIAPDAHATALGLAACYTFWRWLQKPSWRQAILTGLVLGLAELSKTTMILFYPLWPVLWILYRWQERFAMTFQRWRDEAGMLVLRMIVGIYVLNLGYLGEGSFTPLKDFKFVSKTFAGGSDGSNYTRAGNRFKDSWIGLVPMPFPANYVIGLDIQQRDFEDFSRPSYMRGKYQEKGWWYYYAYAIMVKAPLGTLGLGLTAILAMVFGFGPRFGPRFDRRDALILLAPAAVIFAVASTKSGFSHHSRYILPCVPYLFIWMSGLARHCYHLVHIFTPSVLRDTRDYENWTQGKRKKVSTLLGVLVAAFLAWTTVASLSHFPHNMSYFNEIAGGPKNGPSHLLNSNIDWGQDLLFLERWIDTDPKRSSGPVYLAFDNYFSPFDFDIAGIEAWPFEKEPKEPLKVPEGSYALSINQLYEFPWPVRDRKGRRYYIDHRPLAYLRELEPIGWAGYSIRIYSAAQVRQAYAAPEQPKLWPGFDSARRQ